MLHRFTGMAAAAALALVGAPAMAAEGPTDPQIAHVAYTAGSIDVAAARQALAKSRNDDVREFASTMIRDHEAVNAKALELVKALDVTPEDNPTSQSLSKAAEETRANRSALEGAAFDKAFVANEVAFHNAVNGALRSTLIPSARNEQLKSLLQTGLSLFGEHQAHAEQLSAKLK